MKQGRQYIAVDLGAESGRVMLGTVLDNKLSLKEAYRFSNGPIEEGLSLRWDFNKLFSEVKTGIVRAIKQSKGQVSGIGVDSWGVDYGLLGRDGRLIENPYHYRDSRTDGMPEKAFELMDKRDIYENSGVQLMKINTVYQLLSTRLTNPKVLAKAKKLLFIADLVSYFLCGRSYAEYSLASTSQLMDMRTGRWSKKIFEKLDLPMEIVPEVIKPGTVVGELKDELCREFGCEKISIIAVCSHDTGGAVAAAPAKAKHWAYLSSGTWSLMGIETPKAIINDKSLKYSFTNEGGIEDTIRFLKNIMGLWLVQECRRQWQREGVDLSYRQVTDMAEGAEAFVAHIDPDYSGFFSPGDMPKRINEYLTEIGRKPIDDKGLMIRVILESLALKYRFVMETIEDITKEPVEILHIVGGGIQNELLCQFTANATGKKVITGPIEAAAIGNILMQARATEQIKSLSELREIVRNSFELKEYQPKDIELWDKQYEKIKNP
jgi:sugar (pentulose or hexulose) kinase